MSIYYMEEKRDKVIFFVRSSFGAANRIESRFIRRGDIEAQRFHISNIMESLAGKPLRKLIISRSLYSDAAFVFF